MVTKMLVRVRGSRRKSRVTAILEGECTCKYPGDLVDSDCPQAPLHYQQYKGYRSWKCRECGEPMMFARHPGGCDFCGGMRGYDEISIEEMLDMSRSKLLAREEPRW